MTTKAARQGDHDSACGFYAFQNVMRALHPQAGLGDDAFKLWVKLAAAAGHATGLTDSLTRNGMLALAKAAKITGPVAGSFSFETPWYSSTPTLAQFWTRVHDHVEDGGHAIIAFHPDSWPTGHWSVVGRVTARTFRLHDSAGTKVAARGRCRIGGAGSTHAVRPWRIEASSTFLFSLSAG